MNIDTIKNLILCGQETDKVDFKLQFYSKDCKYALIKDVVSFANNCDNADKYIIFGYDNSNKTYKDVDYDDIEDISNYIQLLNEYCEPFIDIALDKIEFCEQKLAYICIKKSNTNRPYVIKKDYQRNGKACLRKGEIFIRKNANNFVCSRSDLEAIYESRKRVTINNPDRIFKRFRIRAGLDSKYIFGVSTNIINDTNINVVISSANIIVNTKTNMFSIEVLYVENHAKEYRNLDINIYKAPLSIARESQLAKVFLFSLSSRALEIIKHSLSLGEKPKIKLMMKDLSENEYSNSFELGAMCED